MGVRRRRRRRTRETLTFIRDESLRRLQVSERAVEALFQEARLHASLAAGLLLVGFMLLAQWRGHVGYETSLEQQSDRNLAFISQEIMRRTSP